MPGELDGKRIAFLATEGVEQVELTDPWKAVEKAGGRPELISRESGQVQAFNHLDKGDTFPVDREVGDADASDYDGLVLPGGVANPDFLRADEQAVAFAREHAAAVRARPARPAAGRLRRRLGPGRGSVQPRAGARLPALAVVVRLVL